MMISNRLSIYGLMLLLGSAITGGLALSSATAMAEPHGHRMEARSSHERPGAHHREYDQHGARKGRGAHQGRGHHGRGHGAGHEREGLFGPRWKTTLSEDQRVKIDRLRVAYAKVNMPLKAKAKAIRLELAALATAEETDHEQIGAKIDELIALKRQMMRQKFEHIAAKRQVLTPEQRPSFDMQVLEHVKHKRGGRKGH